MSNQASKKVAAPTSAKQRAALKKLQTMSAKIRYLTAQGLARKQIVQSLQYSDGRQILYQHVRNVQITPLKKTAS